MYRLSLKHIIFLSFILFFPLTLLAAPSCTFTEDLKEGSRGVDVQCLQTYLEEENFFPQSEPITTYFGPITKAAVIDWQQTHTIEPAVGYFGPISQATYKRLTATTTQTNILLRTTTSRTTLLNSINSLFARIMELYTTLASNTTNTIRSVISSSRGVDNPPDTPTNLTTSAGDATVSLTWTRPVAPDANYINIYRGTSPTSLSRIATTTPHTTSYTDVPVANSTTYYYALTTIDNAGHESDKTDATIASPVGVYDIYVDSVNGNDANDGTSDYEAFATLGAALTAVTSTHGNDTSIGLKAGSHWREEFDLGAYNNITIEGYGDLAVNGFPVVNGADVVTDGWQNSSDREDAYTNTYSINWDHSISSSQQNGGVSVYEDNMIMEWQDSVADVDANPGSFYHDGATSDDTPVIVYMHPSDSGTPDNGSEYEITKRNWVVRVGDDAIVRLVEAKNPGHDNGAINAGSDALVEKSLVYGSPIHDALFKSGTYKEVVAWHPYKDPRIGAIVLEAYDGEADGKTAIWDTVIVVGPPNDSVVGIGGHSDSDSDYASWEIRDSALSNSTIAYKDVITGNVTRTYLNNGSIQFFNSTDSQRTYTVTDPWCHNDIETVTDISRCVWSRQGTVQVNVDGLRSYTRIALPVVEATNVLVVDSVSVNANQDPGLSNWNFIKNTNLAHVAEWHRNIIVGPGDALISLIGSDDIATNNVLFSLGRYRLSNGAGGFNTYTSLATIQGTGIETGTLELDPQLVDPANGDFTPGVAIANGAGLERTDIEYLSIPDTLAEARAWILSQ